LLRKSPRFKGEEHEKRWILRITVNCCIDLKRKNKKRNSLPLEEDIHANENSEEQELLNLVLRLPDKLKAPVHLYYYEGYKVKEISRILEISVSAVKMRLKRGREMLKLRIEEEEHGKR
jgi:RNA polymerase sigma-70 factor (ECF subfamily)